MVSQSVIPSRRSLGGSLPYVFTQEGVVMLRRMKTLPEPVKRKIGFEL